MTKLTNKLPEDFSVEEYLSLNPDVKASGIDAVRHYLEHGVHEDRCYKIPDNFNPEHYLALNLDLKLNQVDPVAHYINHGRFEGRAYCLNDSESTDSPLLNELYSQDGLRSIHNHDFMIDEEFDKAYKRGVEATGADYLWHWRVHIGLWAAQTAYRLQGDFVECGVNKGFLSSSIMELLKWGSTNRNFYLLDTFSGLDCKLSEDEESERKARARNDREFASGFYTTNYDLVKKNFSQWSNVKIIQGSVPITLNQVDSDLIAFLHIDMNCPEPEVAALDFFWQKINIGGVVLLDDYAYYGYQKQKLAMDQWAKKNDLHIASLPTGQGLLIKN